MRSYLTLIIIFWGFTLSAQVEICNNSIDDDGDGLIDLQDTDCNCDQILPSGLIPNESFEIMECCPMGEAAFQCATDWEQAAPTSDYFHTCGITYPTWIFPTQQPPQPLPDGEGYVGFRDGKAGLSNYKEYVGACLTDQMEVGKVYTLDFYLGFPLSTNNINMTIYATTECSNLPFTTQFNTGCPTNSPGWDQLDTKFIQGDTEWLNVTFDLFADKPYTAIILGPGCGPNNNFNNDPYFFVDRLNLVEKVEEGLPFTSIEGSLCEDEITLQLDLGDEFGYQWYNNGIAIPGEETNTITLAIDQSNIGNYSVVISTPAGCVLSEELNLTIPILTGEEEATICEGEVYSTNGEDYSVAGEYNYTLISTQGCDSIITLSLTVLEGNITSLSPTICNGEMYSIDEDILTEGGIYSYSFETDDFCDSLVIVELTVLPAATRTEFFTTCEGDPFVFEGESLTSTGSYPFFYSQVNGCDSTFIVDLTVRETYNIETNASICSGEVFPFGSDMLTEEGIYEEEFTAINGCDSIVILALEVTNATFEQIDTTICDGDIYNLLGIEYSTAGSYQALTTNVNNCDSTIFLELEVITWMNGVELPTDTIVQLGDDISITPIYIAPEFVEIIWLNDSDEIISTDPTLILTEVINRQELTMTAVDTEGCIDEDNIVIRVDRNIGVFAPNIFSPNGDSSNDFFRPIVNESIASLKEINIYDRWGNCVYHRKNFTDLNTWQGWDGKYKGSEASTGVYVFISTFLALDGKEEKISGDITLIR